MPCPSYHCVDPSQSLAMSAGCSSLCRIFPGTQLGYLAAIEGTSGEDRFLAVVLAHCFGFWKPSTHPSKPRDSHCNHAPGLGESSSCSNVSRVECSLWTVKDAPQSPVPQDASNIWAMNCCWKESTRQRVKSLPPSMSDGRQTGGCGGTN